jgi:hypothetical protein
VVLVVREIINGYNSRLNFSSLTSPAPNNLPLDSSGRVVNIGGFGSVSGVRDPRILQAVIKLVF